MVTLSTVTDRVKASGISKVALGSEEVLSIVKTLMYDGCVEEVRAAGRVVSVGFTAMNDFLHTQLSLWDVEFGSSRNTVQGFFASNYVKCIDRCSLWLMSST